MKVPVGRLREVRDWEVFSALRMKGLGYDGFFCGCRGCVYT
jgi:hypothetical protein